MGGSVNKLVLLAGMGGLALAAGTGLRQMSGDRALTGAWIAEFTLDGVPHALPAPTGRLAKGELALIRSGWASDRYLLKVRHLSALGIYDVDFNALGFEARPQNEVPVVGARAYSRDSIEVVLNPQQDHGGVELQGRLVGDSIRGRWYHVRTGGASGTFVLRRAR